MFFKLAFFKYLLLVAFHSPAQVVDDYLEGEKFLLAETKQVNQFLRRFNAEENEAGVRLLEDDKNYHSASLRKDLLPLLFDNKTGGYSDNLKKEFVKDVVDDKNPQFLSFHKVGWFAEVSAKVRYKGKDAVASLFLKLEQENLGYKWVFDKVYFEPFIKIFDIDTLTSAFLHPMSHEIDFMNLQRAFENKDEIEEYTYKYYQPDYLSLFLYEIKQSNLQFIHVKDVKFHFFQVNNWYFEVSEFNRSGYNKGWLISNLVKVPENQKEILKNYIYFGN